MLESPEIALGDRWAELLQLWVAFEKKEKFTERGKVSPDKRPECVSKWIYGGRHRTWRPATTSASKFEKDFHAWWLSLQPKWRLSAKGTILTQGLDGDLEGLRKPGQNGLLSVLAGLFFWGRIAESNAKQRKKWMAHVEDCILVLQQLVG